MVLRVCRGVLGNSDDVHDAFQATFLVLVRKAGSLWVRDSLGPWLHGVALRVANKAKVAAASASGTSAGGAELADAAPAASSTPVDLAPTLHDEIERLPGKYLCADRALLPRGSDPRGSGRYPGMARGHPACAAGSRAAVTCFARASSGGVAPSLGASAGALSAAGTGIRGPAFGIVGSGRDVARGGAVGRGGPGRRRGPGGSIIEDDDHGQAEVCVDPDSAPDSSPSGSPKWPSAARTTPTSGRGPECRVCDRSPGGCAPAHAAGQG